MLISHCKSGKIDNVVFDILKGVQSDIPIVVVTRLEDYVFNDDLLNLDRYVLVDMVEYGWDWDMQATHKFGYNTSYFKNLFQGDEWKRFNYFIGDRQPLLTFKRELLSRDVRKNFLPIEYPATNEIPEPQTKEQFDSRYLQVSNIWGLSHEARKRIHGDIWQQAGKHNYIVCDNIHFLKSFLTEEKHPNKWLTQNVPWYARYEMKTILEITGISKISCSWPGAGRKCFRHTESPVNSVMIMYEDDIAWSTEWVDNVNCIKCEEGKEVERIVEALHNPNLYEIYLNGIDTCRKYYLPVYLKQYIEPLIKSVS